MSSRLTEILSHSSTDIEESFIKLLVRVVSENKKIQEVLDSPLCIETFMQVRYETFLLLSESFKNKELSLLCTAYKSYKNAKTLLSLQNISERDYFREAGMSTGMYQEMQQGDVTLRDLLMKYPGVVFRPLLKTNQKVH